MGFRPNRSQNEGDLQVANDKNAIIVFLLLSTLYPLIIILP